MIRCFILFAVLGLIPYAKAQDIEQAPIDLRQQALTAVLTQSQFDVPVLALIMETVHADVITSLIVFADGSVNLYKNDGESIVGAEEYRQVKVQGEALLQLMNDALQGLTKTTIYPLPKNNSVRFYAVTQKGVLTSEVMQEKLLSNQHILSAVFQAGKRLMAYVKAAGEYQKKIQ